MIKNKGFTVLEFLIVVAMIGIIISIAFASLSLSRSRSRDDQKLARVQEISVGLEEFYKDCKEYPLKIDSADWYPCGPIHGTDLSAYLPDLGDLTFNQTGSDYYYVPLSFTSTLDGTSGVGCTGYHLGALLENEHNASTQRDSQFNSSSGATYCIQSSITGLVGSTTSGFDGATLGMYDIKR